MGFSKEVRESALVASARHCCVCRRRRGVEIEIHHIEPLASGGNNGFENSIALCFDCHAAAGHYNDRHPKGSKYSVNELRRHRDEWHEFVRGSGLRDLTLSSYVEENYSQAFIPMIGDLQSRMQGLFVGSLWEESNPHSVRNIQLKGHLSEHGSMGVWPLSEEAFVVAVDGLLEALSQAARESRKVARFVSTNAMVDSLGAESWVEAMPARRVVEGTQKIMQQSNGRCECWRIFLLRDPGSLMETRNLVSIYSALQENLAIGLRVGVFLAEEIPTLFSFECSDFYCVPRKRVLVSAPPFYFLSEFRSENEYDRDVVRAYTDFSDFLADSIVDPACPFAFEWVGGTTLDLVDRLTSLDEASNGFIGGHADENEVGLGSGGSTNLEAFC